MLGIVKQKVICGGFSSSIIGQSLQRICPALSVSRSYASTAKEVERVSHRDNLISFVQKSESLEKQCLAKAIRSYCELRVLPYEDKKTVVF